MVEERLLRIEELTIRDWRNVEKATLDTNSQFVVLSGQNGSGKTNIMESVYVLSSLRSFRERSPKNFIRFGELATRIEAQIRTNSGLRRMVTSYSPKGRQLYIDGVQLGGIRSWVVHIRSILFSSDQVEIVRGGPDRRRQFLDRARFVSDPGYLSIYREYHHILKQKKSLLKSGCTDKNLLQVWNHKLIASGSRLAIERRKVLEEIRGPFQEMYQFLNHTDNVQLKMIGIGGQPLQKIPEILEKKVKSVLKEEQRQRRVLVGPHRDDLAIYLNDVPIRTYGSQGQQRAVVIALKLAELDVARKKGISPLFLLDDISSELDRERTRKLVQLLSECDCQIWITTTDPAYLGPLPKNSVSHWQIANGVALKT